jgi:integrase
MSSLQSELFPLSGAAGEDPPAPAARAVNALLGAERRRQKDQDTRSRLGAGELVGLLREACSGKRLNDPHAQLRFMLGKADLIAATGRKRKVSEKTRSDFGATLARAIDELRQVRAPVRNIGEIGRAHAIALTRHWVSKGQAAATIQTKSSVLRRYLTLIGKPDAMPAGSAWLELLEQKGIAVAGLRRSKIANVAKAWDANGVNAPAIIQKIAACCPVVAVEMEMQLAFGLRVKEAIQIHPVQADAGARLLVTEGTKGGRQRWVDFDADPGLAAWQREVLERAKHTADAHPKKRLSVPGKSLAQMRNYYYYVLRQNGITHRETGVVSHGLRHQFANRRHEAISGLPAPVLRAAPLQVYRGQQEALREAAQDTTRQLGHWRIDLPAAYNATLPWMSRQARKELDAVLRLFQDTPAVLTTLTQCGVHTAWLIGRAVYGMPIGPEEPLELAVVHEPGREGAGIDLQTRLESVLGRRVTVVSLADSRRIPQDGVELVFPLRARSAEPEAVAPTP